MNNEGLFYGKFPNDFLFGSSSVSHQIEGSCLSDGKSLSIWDDFSNSHPKYIVDRSTANETCDSYRQIVEDVIMLKYMNANAYSFSLSWSRILPEGLSTKINQKGIDYYDDLINTLLENGIEPIITLYHWDLPLTLLNKYAGGWMNENLITAFECFARVCFEKFGDRVRHWITIARPWEHSWKSYGTGAHPPNISLAEKGAFFANTNLLKAHAKVYRLYEREFKSTQNGKIGISVNYSEDDNANLQEQFSRVLYPLFNGEYPTNTSEDRDANSDSISSPNCCPRIHRFEKWSSIVKGSFDYISLNYSSRKSPMISQVRSSPMQANHLHRISLQTVLRTINNEFGNAEVLVSCEGPSLPSTTQMMDIDRAQYFSYIASEILSAIELEGCNVKGFFPGKLMDCWEWEFGFSVSFGLFHVDIDHPRKKRSARASVAFMLKQLFKEKQLQPIFQL